MKNEAYSQQEIRLESGVLGCRLWRNNNGACKDENGRVIRYGLGNDSAKMNKKKKSSDLIGITPVIITPAMVGRKMGVFTSIEAKAPGWHFTGTDREFAQKSWIELVRGLGGVSGFATSRTDLWRIISGGLK